MNISVKKVQDKPELEQVWAIRHEVFVIGQDCPEELEWEFEEESVHFMAKLNDEPCGTARWRKTEKGYKLERFAVLEKCRGNGVASALIKAVITDLPEDATYVYLHAQLEAAGLYEKHNFKSEGEHFWEAGIEHVKMRMG